MEAVVNNKWPLCWLALAFAAAAQEPPLDEREGVSEPVEGEAVVTPAASLLPDRPVMVRTGGSLTYDSNLFRAPDASSERYATAYVGLSIDKAYKQQRFRLDVTETVYRYDNFSHLDFEALNYLGAWNWQLGPRIGGALSATRAQSLVDYSEFRNPGQRNIRTTENFAADAEAWVFGGWRVTGGLSQLRNRYSVPFPQEGSYRASGGEGGVRWVARSDNWVAFKLRQLEGEYLDRPLDPVARLDDGFVRRETEALVAWRFAGKSNLEARAAWIDYRSDHFSERDFSGLAGRLRYSWQIAATLALTAGLAREVEPWADAGASYRLDDRVTLGASWQVAARTVLRVEARRGESDFRAALPGFAGTPRRDREASVLLGAEWRALRNLTLSAAAQRYRQTSSDPAGNFDGGQVTAGASLLF
jgi:exopolysaccharide biosynthesis operon protein EpsL